MKAELVPPQYLHVVWPQVEPMLAPAVAHNHGEYTLDQLKVLLSQDQYKLLVITEGAELCGAVVFDLFNRPNHRVAFVQAIGGRGFVNEEVFDQVCNIARGFGATVMEGATRPSVQKLMERRGMTEKYRIMGLAL